jgi:hypothetical protein
MISDRKFQLWEYHVSHGKLLIRSPATKVSNDHTNIDIKFLDVRYVELPRYMDGIEIASPSEEEVARASAVLGRRANDSKIEVTIILSEGKRFMVVAMKPIIDENDMDCMQSPFPY